MSMPLVSIRSITKSFGPNVVLKNLELDIYEGEFIGLMGPNGAGKSTLIKILDGVYEADGGTISYRNRVVKSFETLSEVGFVHQDLGIVDNLTVLENLRLGLPSVRLFGPILALGKERVLASEALARVELDVPLDMPAGQMSPGEKALLAVARLLSTGAEFLVVDEATSTLPPHDAEIFIAALRRLTKTGSTVVFVSHKLSEIRNACSRGVLLLDGTIAAEERIDSQDEGQLVRMLGSHEQDAAAKDAVGLQHHTGEPVLTLTDVAARGIGPLNLSVKAGEVVGLTGLVGSGLYDVAFLASGLLKPRSGTVEFTGNRRSLVAPQRETEGTIADLSVAENMTLSALATWRNKGGLLRINSERQAAIEQANALNVVPQDIDLPLGSLSGGNQQKVLFGRALLTKADLYVLCEPTRGVDIGARRDLYKVIQGLRDSGAAVLVVTSDSEDLFAVCDRVGVLDAGRINGPWKRAEIDDKALALIL